MTSTQVETDYTSAYEDSSDWCHDCNDRPSIDIPSATSPSGVKILKPGTTWHCPTCHTRWVVARIEEVGLRWMTTGAASDGR
jgi:hypothetical protein